jgi:hypothetical protein
MTVARVTVSRDAQNALNETCGIAEISEGSGDSKSSPPPKNTAHETHSPKTSQRALFLISSDLSCDYTLS